MPSLRNNVDRILKARGLSEADLSRRTKLSRSELNTVLSDPKRKTGKLKEIATELVVPDFFLFSDELTPEETIVDFRQSKPTRRGYQRATIKAIEFAKHVQDDASERGKFAADNSIHSATKGDNIEARANSLREAIGLTDQRQIDFENSRLLYAFVRRQIEELETMVFQFSFPIEDGIGFAITSRDTYNSIVVNTNRQISSRRLFTLAHEVYHCVLNQTGMSDPDIVKNDIERRCNQFAAKFLAPDSLVKRAARETIRTSNFDVEELRNFSNLTKLSMSSSLFRLVESGHYSEDQVARWKAFLKSNDNPDFSSQRGGRRVEEWKYKLSKYGTKFAKIYSELVNHEKIDDYELYRLSGIKPKYQRDYLLNAPVASLQDAQDEVDA
ncbi:ImmA/IrrE family metallo-endopeptidase [Bradyrhizobium sp. SYSU BS000235]|uniref:ImmA/IrrE family metallo-endopeptidase n=1 Tax=Bradyrhizobium sp. SYSU BS000235 TaxID=3411332 RepID=UPI003C7513B1